LQERNILCRHSRSRCFRLHAGFGIVRVVPGTPSLPPVFPLLFLTTSIKGGCRIWEYKKLFCLLCGTHGALTMAALVGRWSCDGHCQHCGLSPMSLITRLLCTLPALQPSDSIPAYHSNGRLMINLHGLTLLSLKKSSCWASYSSFNEKQTVNIFVLPFPPLMHLRRTQAVSIA
jgi:hypothetical protein